jgi:predicted transcriptional regulator
MADKQPLSDPITLRLPQDLLSDIEKIAETLDRTRSWIMVRAMRLYLANEGADVLAAREGLEQIERGESYDFDEVMNELRAELGMDRKVA